MPLGERLLIHSNSPDIYLTIYKGHFATSHSHMNYYIDVATNKASMKEARAIAYSLAETVKYTSHVDTILCLDGTEVIGAFLARAICKQDRFNVNAGADIFILTPEHSAGSQLLFRDNTAPMIGGKDVLILTASVVTGYTAESAIEAIRYYGGNPVEICSIFAALEEIDGLSVRSVFNPKDLPGYFYSPAHNCPMCRRGEKITALVNSFGCSAL
jgi:orotate phosphoribosyltransferase